MALDISWLDIVNTAKKLNVESCALKAVCDVESNGNGFLSDGKPKILFEGHVFWKQLVQRKIDPLKYIKNNEDILYKTWDKSKYKGGSKEYDRLNKAIKINEDAALCSTSWGAFQVMGFNYLSLGYKTVQDFVKDQKDGYKGQLEALHKFIVTNKLLIALQNKDWISFAKGYNGSGYAVNKYDVKLKQAYNTCLITKN